MRVLHLACVAPPQIGGIGQAAYDEVVALRERGVDASLVSAQAILSTHQSSSEQAIIKRLPTLFRYGNAALVRGLHAEILRADVIHLHYPWYGVMERILWLPPKKPVVLHFHMDAAATDWRGWIFALHRHLLQARLMQNATRILVSSYDYAEHSSLAPLLPTLRNKIIELPYGLDTDFFSPASHPVSRPANGRTVLFVGGLDRAHHFKGLPILLQAMADLDCSIGLTIIGDGNERTVFERQVDDLGLGTRVTFLGRVTREVLRDAYRSVDVCAFPSTSVAEAFGLVALEAQSCGLPVVASELPGVRTVVRDGETGILVAPGSVNALMDGLQRLLASSDLRQEYAENARKNCLKYFTRAHHIDKLLEVYQAL